MRRNDEVAAQSRSERDRWTFYETIKVEMLKNRERLKVAPNCESEEELGREN